MMKRILSTLVILLTAASALSEDRQVIPLWGESEPPYAKPHSIKEYQDDNCWGNVPCVHQVVTPTLTLYLPDAEPNGTVVVILPGGGYEVEAVYHEGYEIAELLAGQGTVAAVLKYRLPNPETSTEPWRVPEVDARRALQLLRAQQSTRGMPKHYNATALLPRCICLLRAATVLDPVAMRTVPLSGWTWLQIGSTGFEDVVRRIPKGAEIVESCGRGDRGVAT